MIAVKKISNFVMKKYIPIFIIVILTLVAWYFNLPKYVNIETFRLYQTMIRNFIHEHYFLSICIYCFGYMALVTLAIPALIIATTLGGFLYGPFVAVPLVVCSVTLGSSILFLSARMAMPHFSSSQWVQSMKEGFNKDTFSYLLTLRLIPVIPFCMVTLGAAFLKVPFRLFFIATLVGMIPGTFMYAFIGNSLAEWSNGSPMSWSLIFGIIGIVILSVIPILYKFLPRLIRASKKRYPTQ